MINKNFTFLWSGKIISQLGDKFYAIALAWWILLKTNSPSIMGFFLLVSVLPGLIFGFFAGALTDRRKRKTMLIVTDIIRGILVLAISYLSMTGVIEVWHVFLIGFCLSLVTAFFEPAMQAIIPEIVEKENLTKANGMSQMVSGVCSIAGPLLGAIAVSALGLTWVFLANSISYFISAFLTCFIKINRSYRESDRESDKKANIWEEMKEGISFIKNQKRIILVLKIIAAAHFFMGGLTVLLPFLAKVLEGNGVNNLGYLELMLGAGLFVGSVYMSIKKGASINERALLSFIGTVSLCFIIIGISQYLKINIVYAYMPILMIIGICIAGASVFWQSLLQKYTPCHMTGRVFSVSTLIGNTSLPIAYGIFGILLNLSSIFILMAASGVCLMVLCSYLYFRKSDNRQ
jgi:MFS family permease